MKLAGGSAERVAKSSAGRVATAFRALRHRNFRLFIEGQMCSLIGYWMQNIAQSWLLYRLTESTTLLGMLAFAGSVPILLLAPLAGLWSDRANLHRLMFTIQVLEMVQAAALAALAVSGAIEPWHIVALSMLLGMLVAIELPVRHAYLLELVGDKAERERRRANDEHVAPIGFNADIGLRLDTAAGTFRVTIGNLLRRTPL